MMSNKSFARFVVLSLISVASNQSHAFAPCTRLSISSSNPYGLGTISSHEDVTAMAFRHKILKLNAEVDSNAIEDDGKIKDLSALLNKSLNGDVEATSTLLEAINKFRQEGNQEQIESLLDDILAIVDDTKKPFWSKLRFMAKFSSRSRLAALHRVLNISTPTAPGSEDTDAAKRSRRKRALSIALRSLVSSDSTKSKAGLSMYKIEKAALIDLKQKASSADFDSRIPAGLETPKYEVIDKYANLEVRQYESFSMCTVPMNKARPDSQSTDQKVSQPQLSGASSFGALAGYLFGKNEENVAMKMTTPVLTSGDGDDKEMAFILPSKYWDEKSLSNAPNPLENSLVKLKADEGGIRAVSMFGGFASKKEVALKKEELMANLEKCKEWVPVENSSVTLAQYNDPFTPPWKRRNEVVIPVIKAT